MFRYLLVATLIALTLGAPKARKHRLHLDGRIVGGHDIDIEEVPWQISLEWYGYHICGGSVIDAKYVLTAGHCTDGSTESDLQVRAGTSIVQQDGSLVDIAKINQHPQFDYANIDYDISVLELAESLTLGPTIAAVGLPSSEPADGSVVNVTGWGSTSEGGPSPSQLQIVEVNMINRDECQTDYSSETVSARMICAGVPEGGKDACQGDSGGPLYQAGVIYGTVSWGYGCAREGYPGVYGNVADTELRAYITEITGL